MSARSVVGEDDIILGLMSMLEGKENQEAYFDAQTMLFFIHAQDDICS